MKLSLAIFMLAAAMRLHAAPPTETPRVPTHAPAVIELRDQFDAPQKLSFPTTNVTLLTIADKNGSEQIPGWIAPLKQRFGPRIDIRGIADVSAVPWPLRNWVRKKFQKVQSYPVMMDWSGDAVKAFTYVPDQANVLVLDRRGQIIKRLSGAATQPSVQEVFVAIDRALAGSTPPSSLPP